MFCNYYHALREHFLLCLFQLNGTDLGLANVTQVFGKAQMMMEALETGFPLMSDRLFDTTVWNQVLEMFTMPAMPEMQME